MLQQSVTKMVEQLDNACHQTRDPPEGPSITPVRPVCSGKGGRPMLQISQAVLKHGLSKGGCQALANILQCSARTVHQRALAAGLVKPEAPVYTTTTTETGETTRVYTARPRAPPSITDEQLDAAVAQLLQAFPSFGRTMLVGGLRALGLRVSVERAREAYLRVHGPPGRFSRRTIQRKVYSVAGANSLWHHDGQHGESNLAVSLVPSRLILGRSYSFQNRLPWLHRRRDRDDAAQLIHAKRKIRGT